ncbi:MAG: membrane integrity-associated transporter subunit PqiC [Gammaproteobacteria bacterium]|nr:membrane integrity-associated transporter subunit PqiC [Gammaproteobacteria bacterium]
MNIFKSIQLGFAVVLLLAIAACGKTPAARFYTLNPISSMDVDSQKRITGRHIISIGPVKVAAYLDRSEIVTRTNPTHLELAGFDRWAEPFEEIVASTLAENISSLIPTVFAITDVWPEANVEYHLLVKIKKFESDKNGNISLDADWGLMKHSTRKMSTVYESNIVTSGSSTDYDAITKNMSLALAKLSKEVVAEIKKLGMK